MMNSPRHQPRPQPEALQRLKQLLGWRRIAVALAFAGLVTLLLSASWRSALWVLYARAAAIALVAMLAFGLAEQWPQRLPRWLARWVLQVMAVAATVPVVTLAIYVLGTAAGKPPFYADPLRLTGFGLLTGLGLLLAPWVALAALVRQREAFAREQALAFELERSQYERQALDARMRLLQAQVQPHFLFNTLANVRALVNAGSKRAGPTLDSLIDYLRAAVPRLDEPASTLDHELRMVRAYLELMQMRMPDRLQFSIDAEPGAALLRCPPMTLMTLVENAVRHGIDPAEDGGRIDVSVRVLGGRCHIAVSDTGVGLRAGGSSLGSGLQSLRERLQLAFGSAATALSVAGNEARGVRVEVEFPAMGLA